MQRYYRYTKYVIAATVTALVIVLNADVAAQMGAEPPTNQAPGSGMERGNPGRQQQPGMGRQDPGMGRQDPGAQRQGPGMAPPAPDRTTFTDRQIERFVDAYLEIIDIQENYTSEVQNTQSDKETRKLQEQANDKMVKAIEDNGLSVPEYSDIANAMDMDPELRDEISAKIRKRK